jgi:predicted nucleic acid-binding protein
VSPGAPATSGVPVTPGAAVVSNAGPLIVLAKVNLLHLLKALYGSVHLARSVYDEAVIEGMHAGYEDARTLYLFLAQTGWPVQEVKDVPADLCAAPLDRGERDTLALAVTLGSDLVLMDEAVGRTVARERGLTVRGSLGILIQSYRQGTIDAGQLRLYLAELTRRQDIWINPTLVGRLRREVLGE